MEKEFFNNLRIKYLEDKYTLVNKKDGKIKQVGPVMTEEELKNSDQTSGAIRQIQDTLIDITNSFKNADIEMKDIKLRIRFRPFVKTTNIPLIYDINNQVEVSDYLKESCSNDVYEDAYKLIDKDIYPRLARARIEFGTVFNNGVYDDDMIFEENTIEGNIDLDRLFKYLNICSNNMVISDGKESHNLFRGQAKNITKGLVVENMFNGEKENVITSSINMNIVRNIKNNSRKKTR